MVGQISSPKGVIKILARISPLSIPRSMPCIAHLQGKGHSESFPGDQDEQHAKSGVNEKGNSEDHHSALDQQLSHV